MNDRRLYLPHPDQWTIRTKLSFDREYCHSKFPSEDHYHLLVGGEIHLDNGEQKYCLECSLRMELLTTDRIFWQKERAPDVPPPTDESDADLS